ncbi:cation diffusion facilitator family transporter [Mangrovitalea sediminis]|uniref:cation diffusion facilitator family transporter n=1 Tax=Mangrovitalea sediminis TaxID=1982043 RepID=UPI000BE509E0|nr:cation diffusion facilitator family transporter [Mangrovitalea sediminis]
MGHHHAHPDGQSHHHEHGHGHDHAHGAALLEGNGRAFAIGIGLNTLYLVIETFYGLATGSMGLLADAGHNFSDVLTLLLAWGAAIMAKKSATFTHTYGFRRGTVLSALLSSILLLLALGAITLEAFQRLLSPHPVSGLVMIVVAGVGVVINTATALLFIKSQHHDLNMRGAFLHMAVDAAVSLGVVIAGLGIYFTGWLWLDPAISLLIVAIIFWGTWDMFRESLNLSVDAVPRKIDIRAISEYLATVPGVTGVHDLHVWALSTTDVALTAHLEVPSDFVAPDRWLANIIETLEDRYDIGHATVQVERADIGCRQSQCC